MAGKPDSFAVKVWRDTYAEPLQPAPLLRCDSLGCFGESPVGFKVAVASDPAAFYEDCGDRRRYARTRRHPVAALGPRSWKIRGAGGGAGGGATVAGAALRCRNPAQVMVNRP